ncbi:molybdopterin molybdenumtransferase MoeA, partial [Hansschlegelia beijingensis]
MAQLADDCFAFGGRLMTIEEVLALIHERLPVVVGVETVPLALADGRVAAEDVLARNDVPGFANSAVDGYAVRYADLAKDGETLLPVTARIAARISGDDAPPIEGAARIFTGAPMPPGADTVFMQEDVRLEGSLVALPHGLKPGANMRPAGEHERV